MLELGLALVKGHEHKMKLDWAVQGSLLGEKVGAKMGSSFCPYSGFHSY